jgi:hypothetical protein
MNSKIISKKKNVPNWYYQSKNYYLSLTEKLKLLEIRQKNLKAIGAVIIKLFYEETQRSITELTLRRLDFLRQINMPMFWLL